MSKEKTNIDYLREFIKDNDEALEFLGAVENEISDLKYTNKSLEKENLSQETEIAELQSELDIIEDNPDGVIDCGIGVIKYKTDNLKLQMLMEDFKEKQEKVIYQ